MNGRIHTTLHTLNKLFHTKKPSEMWKLIRKSRPGDGSCNKDIISMDALCNHFSARFTMISNGSNNGTIRAADQRVKEKYNSVCSNINDLLTYLYCSPFVCGLDWFLILFVPVSWYP